MKKRVLSMLLALALAVGLAPAPVFAAPAADPIRVYLTVSDRGSLAEDRDGKPMALRELTVNDLDGSGDFTFHEALVAAHEEYGSADGYEAGAGGVTKLWGESTSNVLFFVNDEGLTSGVSADKVEEGDRICASINADSLYYADWYSALTPRELSVQTGQSITLNLSGHLGMAYSPEDKVDRPISGVSVRALGKGVLGTTDENGTINFSFDEPGRYVISASGDVEGVVTDWSLMDLGGDPKVFGTMDFQTGESNVAYTDADHGNGPYPAGEVKYKDFFEWNALSDEEKAAFHVLHGNSIKADCPIIAPACIVEVSKAPSAAGARVDALIENISERYRDASGEWPVIDMAAYRLLYPQSAGGTSPEAKQALINAAVSKATKGDVLKDTDISKFVIALHGIGCDSRRLYEVNSNEAVDLIAELNKVTRSAGAWNAPYTLAAYSQGDFGSEAAEDALISAVLASQGEDGSWDAWGSKVDATANMIAGLAFYSEEKPEVRAAVDKAVAYLSGAQKDDGSFDSYGYGADANTAAMVVTGLCAAGVDPHSDARFVKNGSSALDGLMAFALAGDNGFGYTDNTTLNASATEQGFRALIAAVGLMESGRAFNVYDFSGNAAAPARATGSGEVQPPASPSGDDISVTVTVKSDRGYWLNNYSVTLPGSGARVYHAFVAACDENGISYVGAGDGYVRSMSYRGTSLGEFDLGPNSGWLYKVGGVLPDKGILEYGISDGDAVTFYYTEDWTKDPSAAANAGLSLPEPAAPAPAEEKPSFKDIAPEDWYGAVAEKAAGLGLFSGFAAGEDGQGEAVYEFRGAETMTRAMFVSVLRALDIKLGGEDKAPASAAFADVAEGAWYARALGWADSAGLVAGFADGSGAKNFAPELPVTREQLAVFIYAYARSLGKADGDTQGAASGLADRFSDSGDISAYAREAVYWLSSNGLLAGSGGRLDPKGLATRAQVAALAVACYEFLSK